MFRRRAIRSRRMARRQKPHPLLQRANDLMASGDYQGAALLFNELAGRAASRNGPAAPHLLIQAGRAYIKAGQSQVGVDKIKKALQFFVQREEWVRFQRTRSRGVDQLNQMDLSDEAAELEIYLSDEVPSEFLEKIEDGFVAPVSKAVARLPLNCPGCGGPIRSDQVEWVDEITAECPYCGGMLRD